MGGVLQRGRHQPRTAGRARGGPRNLPQPGDGISGGAELVERQVALIHHPAIAVAVACAARGVALVVGDDERAARAEFRNAASGDEAVHRQRAPGVKKRFVCSSGAELQIRIDDRHKIESARSKEKVPADRS